MKIIGISGKKRSGKNTVANFLNGVVMKKNGLVADLRMTDLGELEI
jgi:pantothenate kinase-related protein Tda10